jgi:A/G-specific adenine glycosylase
MEFDCHLQKLDKAIAAKALTAQTFRRIVLGFYTEAARSFPWRETHDPYGILVSEIMLQQTQTSRVEERYPEFLRAFPTVRALAKARQSEVLALWQGMGYYRRARNLHKAAIMMCEEHRGVIPDDYASLRRLPGIGDYTAAAISAFAFNKPIAMIETNIRAVYLYAWYPEQHAITDKELFAHIERTMDTKRPRDWFYALMDFGVALKKARPRIHERSKHHVKQSAFEGSDRQLAARILKAVLASKSPIALSSIDLGQYAQPTRVKKAVERLVSDKLIVKASRGYLVAAD